MRLKANNTFSYSYIWYSLINQCFQIHIHMYQQFVLFWLLWWHALGNHSIHFTSFFFFASEKNKLKQFSTRFRIFCKTWKTKKKVNIFGFILFVLLPTYPSYYELTVFIYETGFVDTNSTWWAHKIHARRNRFQRSWFHTQNMKKKK